MQAKAQIALHGVGEPPEDIDDINKAVDKLKEDKDKQRDRLNEKKLREIEEAYHKWLAEQKQQNTQENGDLGGNAGRSMRFSSEDKME